MGINNGVGRKFILQDIVDKNKDQYIDIPSMTTAQKLALDLNNNTLPFFVFDTDLNNIQLWSPILSDWVEFINNVNLNSFNNNLKTISENTILTFNDYGNILCNSLSNIELLLPTAINNNNLKYSITNISTGNVNIVPFGSEKIHTEDNFILYEYETIVLISNGLNWYLGG